MQKGGRDGAEEMEVASASGRKEKEENLKREERKEEGNSSSRWVLLRRHIRGRYQSGIITNFHSDRNTITRWDLIITPKRARLNDFSLCFSTSICGCI